MSDVKLYYFNGTGRANHIRLALAAGGVAFEDVLAGMPVPPETKEKWGSLTKGTTTFSVPIMTVNEGTDAEKVYVQSSAVFRAAGRKGDLKMTGVDDPEDVAYLTDRAIADADDLRSAAYKGMVMFGASKEDADKYAVTVFPKHVKAIEAQLESFGPDALYWGGSSTLSLADVTLYEAIEFFGRKIFEGIDDLEGLTDPVGPAMKAWLERVGNDASLKAYLESEQFTNLAFKFTKAVIGR